MSHRGSNGGGGPAVEAARYQQHSRARQVAARPVHGSTPFGDSPTVGRSVDLGYTVQQHSQPVLTLPTSASSGSGNKSEDKKQGSHALVESPVSLTVGQISNPSSSPRSVPGLADIQPLQPKKKRGKSTKPKSMNHNRKPSAEQTAFYSDSSASSSPEPQEHGPAFSSSPSANLTTPQTRTESNDAVKSKPNDSEPVTRSQQGLSKDPRPVMAARDPALAGQSSELPRNSSIDSAISAVSSKSRQTAGSDAQKPLPDVATLIQKAGSAEALIQSLLKEKQAQTQQNSQLWRLVDKQRAMVLGLNKDLERALKDKEKYRKKLKDFVASTTEARQPSGSKDNDQHEPNEARQTGDGLRETTLGLPSSDADGRNSKVSPIGLQVAPYPITPPADAVHAPGKALRTTERTQLESGNPSFRQTRGAGQDAKPPLEIQYNPTLPASRSLPSPSDPPKIAPPAPPAGVVPDSTPKIDPGQPTFSTSPPRKAPPAPLRLRKNSKAIDDVDSESDYDELLSVDNQATDRRGRRRTREDDDRERAKLAIQEAEARSTSKKSKSSQPPSEPDTSALPSHTATVPSAGHERPEPASLAAVLNGEAPSLQTREVNAPLMSPGLPASPRPVNLKSSSDVAPLSPRTMGAFPATPLSPRPPRQPIPLPPNVSLNTDGPLSPKPLVVPPRGPDSLPSSSATRSPTERTEIFKGLMTDEQPDLLLAPNALPSVAIRVASSRMKPSRASLMSLSQLEEDPVFTLAVITRSDSSELWRVEKDSGSLTKLDARLKQCAGFNAKTPDKSMFLGHAPAKIDARRIALEHYMEEVMNTPFDNAAALELCRYLSTNTLAPNSDETGSLRPAAAQQGPAHKLGPEGRPVRSGYLTKKGKNFGGWKARFFSLDGPHLKYFEGPGGAHLGTIKLQNAQIGKQSPQADAEATPSTNDEELDNQYRHAFLILEPKRKDSNSHVKHVLCAENDKERDIWVDALIQWVDYQEDDEKYASQKFAKPTPLERQATPPQDALSQNKLRKSQARSNHQTTDSDTLVGVRYDSTSAGEAPQSAPPRPKTSNGLPESASLLSMSGDTSSQQGPIVISGPKDPQPISDIAAWGNKTALSIPSNEEKKQRKRSFFGFGPKARSHSEGPDAGDGSGSNAARGSNQSPVRPVFGIPLAEAAQYCSPSDVNVPLPCVVYRCVEYLEDQNAVLEEGIFRLSGSNLLIKQLKERFNTEGDINLVADETYYDMHAVASLLKLYLRELPTTILTRELHMEFLQIIEVANKDEKTALLAQLARRLPQANATLLKYLIAFLIKVINNSDINKMTIRNVGIVFSPTLNIPAPVFAFFLQNYEAVFGVNPDDYELPSPISDTGPEDRSDDPQFGIPARPSTSSSNASPHRQPRLDPVRDGSRGTPTPPLLNNLNTARASPTPPMGLSRSAYDLGRSPGGLSQPNYDIGAYDMHRAPQRHNSGDDYSSAPHDPSQRPSSLRRDSSGHAGSAMGLHPQGSRSRLREETKY